MSGRAQAVPPESGPDRGLRRSQRLVRPQQFREAYEQGRKFVGRLMVLYLRGGEETSLRLGVVASRKVGGAVQRARAKRVLREAYRLNRHRFQGAWDVVLVARRDVLKVKTPEAEKELIKLARRAKLLAPNQAA